jgi:DNA repair protein RadA/Sms
MILLILEGLFFVFFTNTKLRIIWNNSKLPVEYFHSLSIVSLTLPNLIFALKMAKQKTAFYCRSCGFESPKWIGKCPGCNQWNTLSEEMKPSNNVQAWKKSSRKIVSPTPINEIQTLEQERWILSDSELNLVLGGGVVAGSIILLGGEPGIGKSTLLLQMALQTQANVLYVSGEESETFRTVKARFTRSRLHSNPIF